MKISLDIPPLNPLLFRNEEEFNQYKEAAELDPTLLTTEKQTEFYKEHYDRLSVEGRKKTTEGYRRYRQNMSEEEKRKRRDSLSKSWTKEKREAAQNRWTKERREKQSKLLKGIPTNRAPAHSGGWGISGIREDLNQFFRSTWEANFARILNHLKIKWVYEPTRFTFEHFSYLPDFYLPETDSYIEVTPYFTKLKADKILAAAKIIKLQIINKTIYNQLEKEYKYKILNWENDKKKPKKPKIGKCINCGADMELIHSNQKFCGHSCLIAFRKKNREKEQQQQQLLANFAGNILEEVIRQAYKKDRDFIIPPPLITYTKKS